MAAVAGAPARLRLIAGRVRHVSGWHPNRPALGDVLLGPPPPGATFPAAYQLPWVVPIFDQGQVGDCVANMVAAILAWLDHLAGRPPVVYSRYFLYAVARLLEGTPLSEDSGAQIRDGFAAAAQGACLEGDWSSADPSAWSSQPTPEAYAAAKAHQLVLQFLVQNDASCKRSLLDGFPLGCGIRLFESFESDAVADSGLAPMPAKDEQPIGGHAVVRIGWDDNLQIGSSRGAWIYANSWGSSWGNGGRFALPYDADDAGLVMDKTTARRLSSPANAPGGAQGVAP